MTTFTRTTLTSQLTSDELTSKLKAFIFDEMAVDSLVLNPEDWNRSDISYEGMIFEIRRNIWGSAQVKFPKSTASPMDIAERINARAKKVIEKNTGLRCRSHAFWNEFNQIICENYGENAIQCANDLYMDKPKKPVMVDEGEKTIRLVVTSQYTVFEEMVVEVPAGYVADDVENAYVEYGDLSLAMVGGDYFKNVNVICKHERRENEDCPEWIGVDQIEENDDGTLNQNRRYNLLNGEK